MLTASCRLMLPCKEKNVVYINFIAHGIMSLFSSLRRLQLLHSVMTHRLSLADQKLVEFLQQGGFSDNLPAHVGVPGLLIRIPGGNGSTF